MGIRHLSVRFFSAILVCVVFSLYGESGGEAFVMPVKATAFEVRNQELLRMGENALGNHDFVGALSYFHELREKLSGNRRSSDYVLASSLVAESCLGFPDGSMVGLRGSQGVRVNVSTLSSEILQGSLPGGVSSAVSVHRAYVRGQWLLKRGDFRGSRSAFRSLWGQDEAQARLVRLGDLHNWILLMYMQSVSAGAESTDDLSEATSSWRLVRDLSSQVVSPLPKVSVSARSSRSGVTVQAGELLQRSPRLDVLEGEFIRLRANALVELGDYGLAEQELRKPSMSMYAADRNLMLLSCVARQGRVAEACHQYEHCEREYGGQALSGWRQALWSMFSMYYSTGRFGEAEPFLVRLESRLRPEERYKWLMLRLKTLRGRLSHLLQVGTKSGGDAMLVSSLDSLYNNSMKYASLFPEACQPGWSAFVQGLSGDRRRLYFGDLSELLYLLGRVSQRAGNVNSAIEIYGRIGRSSEVSDSVRYKSWMSLGEVSSSDIQASIEAFKSCVDLAGISNVQRAEALYCAAKRALQEASRQTAAESVRVSMGNEAEKLLKVLCLESVYHGTLPSTEAAYSLADYLYSRRRYADASAYYERYFMSTGVDLRRRDVSRLRWSRCWRLLGESTKPMPSSTRDRLLHGMEILSILRTDAVDQNLRSQAYLETYRVALVLDDTELGLKMLDELLSLPLKAGEKRCEAFWIGLYERTLCYYQRHEFERALASGRQFLREREGVIGSVPWEQEFWLLLGDIHGGMQSWNEAAEMYGKVTVLSQVTSQELLSYGKYEEAYCLFMAGKLKAAKSVLSDYFSSNRVISREYLYRGSMLLGDVLLQLGEYVPAREQYARAQGVYGSADTFRSNVAKCRQGEVFLMSAESQAGGSYDSMLKSGAIGSLERASEIFGSLMKEREGSSGVSPEQDHYLDLRLRAQYRLGLCYELVMKHGKGDVREEAREKALWCYQRVCDFFVERAKSGVPVSSSRFYVKSLDRRVRLLTGTDEPVTQDTMELIARLYEQYAELGLTGSVVARRRAAEIRQSWQ